MRDCCVSQKLDEVVDQRASVESQNDAEVVEKKLLTDFQ